MTSALNRIFGTIFSSLPFNIGLVVCFFIFITRKQWQILVRNLRLKLSLKSKDHDTQQNRKENEEDIREIREILHELNIQDSESFKTYLGSLFSELEKKKDQLAGHQNLIDRLVFAIEYNRFLYLNLHLVYNTKLALWWFNNNRGITKSLFMKSFSLPPEIENPDLEREAIFNALLTNNLITQNNDYYTVTETGIRFLKFVGFIK